MKHVEIAYYAILREESGRSGESIETVAATYHDLYEHLRALHGFSLPASLVRASVHGAFVEMDEPLTDGASVVFIPPVAGG